MAYQASFKCVKCGESDSDLCMVVTEEYLDSHCDLCMVEEDNCVHCGESDSHHKLCRVLQEQNEKDIKDIDIKEEDFLYGQDDIFLEDEEEDFQDGQSVQDEEEDFLYFSEDEDMKDILIKEEPSDEN